MLPALNSLLAFDSRQLSYERTLVHSALIIAPSQRACSHGCITSLFHLINQIFRTWSPHLVPVNQSPQHSNSCLLLLRHCTTMPVTACIKPCISCRTSPHPLITQQILTGGESAYFPCQFHLPLDPTPVPTCAAFKLALCWFA